MSRTCGIFSRMTGSSVRSAAAIAGSAAFFAPLTLMVPSRGLPPRMTNLSMSSDLAEYCNRDLGVQELGGELSSLLGGLFIQWPSEGYFRLSLAAFRRHDDSLPSCASRAQSERCHWSLPVALRMPHIPHQSR